MALCTGKFTNAAEVAPQNSNFTGCGAYTGEMAVDQMADMGIKWVLLGHSERRGEFGLPTPKESNALLATKLAYVLEKVRGTAPLSTTPYCSRSPTRRLSAPSSPPPLNGVATVPSPQRRTSGAALSPGCRGSPWSLAAAEEEEEEEGEGATVGGEAEHLALREIWRGCISALDLRDLPALHGHAPPLRRLVWRRVATSNPNPEPDPNPHPNPHPNPNLRPNAAYLSPSP